MSEQLKNNQQITLLWCPKCKIFWWNEGETVCPNDCGTKVIEEKMVNATTQLEIIQQYLTQKEIDDEDRHVGWMEMWQKAFETIEQLKKLVKGE